MPLGGNLKRFGDGTPYHTWKKRGYEPSGVEACFDFGDRWDQGDGGPPSRFQARRVLLSMSPGVTGARHLFISPQRETSAKCLDECFCEIGAFGFVRVHETSLVLERFSLCDV